MRLLPETELLKDISAAFLTYLGAVFISYCLIYFLTCPSPALAGAVTLEIISFSMVVSIRYGMPRRGPRTLARRLRAFVNARPILRNTSYIFTIALLLVNVSAAVVSTYDFTALSAAALGDYKLSANLYSTVPTSQCLGLHPAATLEMLTGACVQSHKLARAEQMYYTVLEVRQRTLGAEDHLVAALYADLGELFSREKRSGEAEAAFQKSIALNRGQGRALAGLANLLLNQNRLDEAEPLYEEALALRLRNFGPDSGKYKETLMNYQELRRRKSSA